MGRAHVAGGPGTNVAELSGREPVYEATTEEEREEIWAFRHSVYVEELGRKTGRNSDGRVHDPEDDLPSTIQLYTRDDRGVSGVLRMRSWPPGEIPAHDFEELSLGRFPGIERLATCEIGRLMVRPSERGSLLFVALLSAVYELGIDRFGSELAFVTCVPSHVHLYRRLGLRPYDARLVQGPDTVGVPLVLVVSDLGAIERANSFLLPLAKRRFGPGGRPCDCLYCRVEKDRAAIARRPQRNAPGNEGRAIRSRVIDGNRGGWSGTAQADVPPRGGSRNSQDQHQGDPT